MTFANPYLLVLLAPLLVCAWDYYRNRHVGGSVSFSHVRSVAPFSYRRGAELVAHLPFLLRFVALLLLVSALARPQTGVQQREISAPGIDIMLALDLSSSMSAEDLRPNRLAAAKKVLANFIAGRSNDRIGLVVFAKQGYTQTPLTLDYPVLSRFLENSYIGVLDDGTAIGMAIATAANRLKDSAAKSKIAVLLTDGENNSGAIDPITAAKMAKAVGVKVYTIGVGKEGVFYQTVNDPRMGKRKIRVRTRIDEPLLKKIATITGGLYFRAENEKGLADIYQQIDQLEKTDVKVKLYTRYTDWFHWLLIPAAGLLLLELLLPLSRWRSLP